MAVWFVVLLVLLVANLLSRLLVVSGNSCLPHELQAVQLSLWQLWSWSSPGLSFPALVVVVAWAVVALVVVSFALVVKSLP